MRNDYLTPAEAASLSGAQRSYIYNVIATGALETRAIAGRRFILRSSFERWCESYKIRRHIPRGETLQAGAPA